MRQTIFGMAIVFFIALPLNVGAVEITYDFIGTYGGTPSIDALGLLGASFDLTVKVDSSDLNSALPPGSFGFTDYLSAASLTLSGASVLSTNGTYSTNLASTILRGEHTDGITEDFMEIFAHFTIGSEALVMAPLVHYTIGAFGSPVPYDLPTTLSSDFTLSTAKEINDNDFYHLNISEATASVVPEPATFLLLGSGLLGLVGFRRKFRRVDATTLSSL